MDVFSARPLVSTSAMLICTEAWSLDVISRSEMNVSLEKLYEFADKRTRSGTFTRNVKVNENTLITCISFDTDRALVRDTYGVVFHDQCLESLLM